MLERSQVKTLPEVFSKRVAQTPMKLAYQYFDKAENKWISINWRELYVKSLAYRHAINAEKLAPGSRILLAIENSIDWICLEQAALQLGHIVVAVSPLESLQRIRQIIEDCEPSLAIFESDRLLESLQLTKKPRCIVLNKYLSDFKAPLLEQWLQENKDQSSTANNSVSESDIATIIYTAGTSGVAKGVMLSHQSIINNALTCAQMFSTNENDKFLSVTPFSHIMGRVVDYYQSMLIGAPLVFNKALGMIEESVKRTHPTILNCTPYILECAYHDLIKPHPAAKKGIEKYLDYRNGIGSWRFSFLLKPFLLYQLKKHIRQHLLVSLRAIYTGGASLSNTTLALINELDL
ncbi:MAG: AMP-binding protein, partial [Gammaproteobacteria bacterium]|nr:AMP-binding protein [Gammaproteobacteria bacterium]